MKPYLIQECNKKSILKGREDKDGRIYIKDGYAVYDREIYIYCEKESLETEDALHIDATNIPGEKLIKMYIFKSGWIYIQQTNPDYVQKISPESLGKNLYGYIDKIVILDSNGVPLPMFIQLGVSPSIRLYNYNKYHSPTHIGRIVKNHGEECAIIYFKINNGSFSISLIKENASNRKFIDPGKVFNIYYNTFDKITGDMYIFGKCGPYPKIEIHNDYAFATKPCMFSRQGYESNPINLTVRDVAVAADYCYAMGNTGERIMVNLGNIYYYLPRNLLPENVYRPEDISTLFTIRGNISNFKVGYSMSRRTWIGYSWIYFLGLSSNSSGKVNIKLS